MTAPKGPGSGRYTTFVPAASTTNVGSKQTLLWKLFNGNAGNKGQLYGATTSPQQSNSDAAAEAVKIASKYFLPADKKQVGDADMFSNGGVDLTYGDAPDTSTVAWASAGGPANAYVPDVSSPGPEKTRGLDKASNPNLTVQDFKGTGYTPGAPDTGTASPSSTSSTIGAGPLGKSLTPGKSGV